jgi:carbon-monoxide dehydrogenase medium subunit
MYPAKFDYVAPSTLDEAIRLLAASGGEAKILAGGHSILPMLKLRLAQPGTLIDIGRIPGLNNISVSGDGISIGALVTHAQVSRSADVRRGLPALAEAAGTVGDIQVRNRGTIGGSLAHADPAGDIPAAFLALDGQIVTQGPNGSKTYDAAGFFVGILTTALGEDEIVTAVKFPALPARTGSAYVKFDHPASHYALTGVAASITVGGDGRITRARIGVTGVGPVAYRAKGVEAALIGQDASGVAGAVASAADGIDCNDDIHASAEYRAHLARVFTRRAVEEALRRAG